MEKKQQNKTNTWGKIISRHEKWLGDIERKRKKDNTYSKSAGILNIKELNSMLKFPKYLFINITPCFLRNTDVHYYKKIESL